MANGKGKEKESRKQEMEVKKPTVSLRPRRTGTGCITCRVRCVKCDGARPSCVRCRSTGRNCDGYSAAPVTRDQICDLLRNGSSLTTLRNPAGLFENERESRCFDFFRSVSAPNSTTFYGSNFWLRRVLQMCHSEPAIKHATLALSSLHRHYEFEHLPQSDQERTSALLYYSRAVSQTRSLLSQNTTRENIERLLVICLLFICYENVTGNFPAAQMHIRNGLCILSEFRKPSSEDQPTPHHAIPDDILQAFSRVSLVSTSLSDSRAPNHFSKTSSSEPDPIPTSFSAIDEAQYHLFEQFKEGWVEEELLLNAGVSIPPRYQSPLESRLNTWKTSFATFQLHQGERRSSQIAEMESGLALTQIYYEMFTLSYNFNFTRVEISYDTYSAKIELILSLIDSLSVSGSGPATIGKPLSQRTFSFERGIIVPLFFIAVQCRDLRLRRQALDRLCTLHRREGGWNSVDAARVAEQAIVASENEGLDSPQTVEDIINEQKVAFGYGKKWYKAYRLMMEEALKAKETYY